MVCDCLSCAINLPEGNRGSIISTWPWIQFEVRSDVHNYLIPLILQVWFYIGVHCSTHLEDVKNSSIPPCYQIFKLHTALGEVRYFKVYLSSIGALCSGGDFWGLSVSVFCMNRWTNANMSTTRISLQLFAPYHLRLLGGILCPILPAGTFQRLLFPHLKWHIFKW